MNTSIEQEVAMLSRIAEDAAAIASMGLFLTMIALWSGALAVF
jgi:hypothetical protein